MSQSLKFFRIIFTVGLNFLLLQCSNKTSECDNIEKVYTADGKNNVVLFDTDTKKSQVLIQDSESVFFVMETSKNKEWVELSKMPANPDEANGTNEKKLLMYIPQKRIICHPKYGSSAYLVGIDITNNIESILWYMDDDTVDTIPIVKLEKTCLKGNNGCNCESEL
jgi:hypothetical protein